MARTSRDETTERLNRLAGSGRGSGGGLPLPNLFAAMLNEVLDSAPVSTRRMTELASSVLGFKEQAVFATWPSWEAFTADALAQMESRKVIQHEDGSWVAGPKLVTGRRVEIIPARPDVGSNSDGVTVWPREVREARSSADHAIRTFAELDAEVAQRGSRRVTTARKELILESIRQLGDLREFFPVLLDELGNVVDGRHRREIDPDWPAARMRVPAEKRLAAAAAANRANAWSDRDWKALLDKVMETTDKKTDAVRTLIRLALLEDASRSNVTISKLVGCSPNTVQPVREQLETASQIARQRSVNQHAHRDITDEDGAPPPSQRQVPEETAEAIAQEAQRRLEAGEPTDFRGMADRYGVGQAFVQQRIAVAKDRMERGEPAAAPRPSPAVTAEPSATTESAWSKIVGRIERFASRWREAPPDRDSELKELEALRREIDERIEALRR